MTTEPIKPPYRLIGVLGTTIWAGDMIVASFKDSQLNKRHARKTAEFIVRACNRDHLFDDMVKALAVAKATIELLEQDSTIQIGKKPMTLIQTTLIRAKEHST